MRRAGTPDTELKTPGPLGARSLALIGQALLIGGLLAGVALVQSLGWPSEGALFASQLALIGTVAWCFVSWRLQKGRLFDIYPLFLASLGLFHGGEVLTRLLGLGPTGFMRVRFSSKTEVTALFFVMLALAFVHLGALLTYRGEQPPSPAVVRSQITESAIDDMRCIGYGLLLISVPAAVWTFQGSLTVVASSGYFGLYQRQLPIGIPNFPALCSTFLTTAVLFIVAGGRARPGIRKFGLAVILTGALLQLFQGARAAAVVPIIAYAWFWHRCVRSLSPVRVALPAAFSAALILPAITDIRHLTGHARLSPSYFLTALAAAANSPSALLNEMGATLRVVAHTIELVPELRPFDAGRSYFYALLAVLPNLGSAVHASAARGSLSRWLVSTVEPGTARSGGGLGFSAIAEAYLNFGWHLAPVFFLVLGLLFGRLTTWVNRTSSPVNIAAVAAALPFILIYARAESVDFVRGITWYSLIPYFAVRLLSQAHHRGIVLRSCQRKALAAFHNNESHHRLAP